jgi:hypothetical protein
MYVSDKPALHLCQKSNRVLRFDGDFQNIERQNVERQIVESENVKSENVERQNV